jgi:hypothetical protein
MQEIKVHHELLRWRVAESGEMAVRRVSSRFACSELGDYSHGVRLLKHESLSGEAKAKGEVQRRLSDDIKV